VSIQRHREKTRAWREWLRHHHPVLSRCGLPADALRSELDWLVFLDHGYVQSAAEPPANWWSVRLMAAEQAARLSGFIERQYPGRYPKLRLVGGEPIPAEPRAAADRGGE
jgi:hypothetical protein